MSHLAEGQFEDILQGRAEVPEHVDGCPQCRARLEEKRALAHCVHRAFSSVHASTDLGDRIRARLAAGQPRAEVEAPRHIIFLRARRHLWTGLAVAAAILVIAVPRSLRMNIGPRTTTAQTALAGIHFANLGSLEEIMAGADSGRHCPCMEGHMDGSAPMPCCKRGLCGCGCQMRDFQGRRVASCVIQEPNAPPVSVVVVPKLPEALGMTVAQKTTATGQTIWQATCGLCNMASIRMGEGACCVIGQVTEEDLIELLNALEE